MCCTSININKFILDCSETLLVELERDGSPERAAVINKKGNPATDTGMVERLQLFNLNKNLRITKRLCKVCLCAYVFHQLVTNFVISCFKIFILFLGDIHSSSVPPEGNSVHNLANQKICTPNIGTAAGTDVTNKGSSLSYKDSDITAPKVSNAIDQREETVNNKSKTHTSVKERNIEETSLGSSSSKSTNQQLQMTKKDTNNNQKPIGEDSSKIGHLIGKQRTDRTTNVHEKEGNRQVAQASQERNVSPSVVDSRAKESATDNFGLFGLNSLADMGIRYNACDMNTNHAWLMADEIPDTEPVFSYPWEKKEGDYRELENKTPTTSGLSRKVVNNEDMTVFKTVF